MRSNGDFYIKIIYLYILDVDECLEPDTCPSNSVCTNSNGSFSCSCIDNGFEYNGLNCVGKWKVNKKTCYWNVCLSKIFGKTNLLIKDIDHLLLSSKT